MPSSALPQRSRYERGAARIFAPDGGVVGAGFLLADQLVCTCAHVVQQPGGDRPEGPVAVDFPLLAGADEGTPVRAEVAYWRPGEDIAVLRLATAVHGAEPLPLADATGGEWGGEIRAFGFPEDAPRGVNATGVLRGRQRADRLQLDLAAHGVPIGRGFSGAAVWDVERDAVVGMLVTRGRYGIRGTAYLIPSDRLTGTDVPLPCPFRGLDRFEEEDARYFHGRENETRELVSALGSRPLTVLVGPSGSGKSSLLRAGLLVRLRERDIPSALRIPRPPQVAGVLPEHADSWVAEAVTAAWHAAAPDHAARRDRLDAVREACAGSDGERIALRGRLCDELGPRGAVLLLDQFEEYAAASPRGALRAFQVLSALAQAPDPAQGGGLRVLLTARPGTLEALTAAETAGLLSRSVAFLAPMTDEALIRVIEEPVKAVPGLRIEAGLTRRLVDDAVGEPGCLPLLQFALTQLWRRNRAGTLTHAAYEELGGVGGALAAYADQALGQCLAESGAHEDSAGRLFQQLARPDGRGGFTRRAVPIHRLTSAQAGLARALAGHRLLVWDVPRAAADGDSRGTVHVVHEALLGEWPRLAGWLNDGAEFRAWQERTAEDAAEWEKHGRREGLLPHGARLAQGLEWLGTRSEDITDVERAYLEAGRRRQRRGLRRLWALTGLVTALALVATALAVDTYRARQRDLLDLRMAAATELAELSGETADRSPESAFRYAAAAWTARHTPAAQKALFGQYVRAQDTLSSHSGLWRGTVQSIEATPDGDTLVVVSQPDGSADLEATVVTHARVGRPRAARLRAVPTGLRLEDFRDAVSDDGRWYALATSDGEVLLWNLADPESRPRSLSGPLADRGDVYASPVDFSEDGGRLLHFLRFEKPRPEDAGRRALVRLWHTATGRSLPASQRSVDPRDPDEARVAWLLGKGDRIAVGLSRRVGDGEKPRFEQTLDIRATASGERVRRVFGLLDSESQQPAHRGRGVWVELRDGGVRWYSLVSGEDQPSGTLKGRISGTDLTGTHLVRTEDADSAGSGAFQRVTVLDPRGGHRYWRATVPGTPLVTGVAVAGSGPGPRTLVAARGDSLLRVRLVPEPLPLQGRTREVTLSDTALTAAPDGSRTARLYRGRLEVLGPGTRTHDVLLPESVRSEQKDSSSRSLRLLWVARPGEDALLVWSQNHRNALVYEADTLRRRASLRWDCGRTGSPGWNVPEDVVQTTGGELVLLCLGESLVRLDPRTWTQSGGPVHLERTPRKPGNFAVPGQLMPRPGHRDQVAVVTDRWSDSGRLEVWDVRRGTRLARLNGPPLGSGAGRWAVFTQDGDRLAVFGDDRRVTWWAVDDERRDGRTRSLTDATGLLGVAADGTVVVRLVQGIGLFSPGSGERLGGLEGSPADALGAWRVDGDTLHLLSDEDDLTLRLSPAHWYSTLCSAVDGPYRPAQRAAPRLELARETEPCPGSAD
ncbi:nSTAND1 domain-containing NTPase [Streptomyces xinghaiensis]|uniref:nSTAND1 domain-containing NTPase n=1 Tax=Streptomyces xinghaiensis TaxID=1038928 RepID=UPI003435D485